MKKFLQDEPSADDLILIWRAQALVIATLSKTPDPVARFLGSKHIPEHEAAVAAIMIWNEAQKSRIKASLPSMISGAAILAVGLLYAILMFQSGSVFFLVGLGPIALGVWFIWDGYPGRE
jgi:hypothetical protein